MDDNPYKSPLKYGGKHAFDLTTVKRWMTIAFLICLGISGVSNGILGVIGLLPWSGGRLISISLLFMGAIYLTAGYQYARQSRR